jgi:hypothetical protein
VVARPSAVQAGRPRAAAARGAKIPAVVTLTRASPAAYRLDLVERRTPVRRPWLWDTAALAVDSSWSVT